MNTFIFIGLGNPGAAYEGTRHNVGVALLRQWVEAERGNPLVSVREWREEKGTECEVAQVSYGDGLLQINCVFPLTFMNESGRAVAAYMRQKGALPTQALIVHDDLELPFGEVAYTAGGSAKGHKGVRSIQALLDTSEISRVRVGIGRPPGEQPVEVFVLSRFSSSEREQLHEVVQPLVFTQLREFTQRQDQE